MGDIFQLDLDERQWSRLREATEGPLDSRVEVVAADADITLVVATGHLRMVVMTLPRPEGTQQQAPAAEGRWTVPGAVGGAGLPLAVDSADHVARLVITDTGVEVRSGAGSMAWEGRPAGVPFAPFTSLGEPTGTATVSSTALSRALATVARPPTGEDWEGYRLTIALSHPGIEVTAVWQQEDGARAPVTATLPAATEGFGLAELEFTSTMSAALHCGEALTLRLHREALEVVGELGRAVLRGFGPPRPTWQAALDDVAARLVGDDRYAFDGIDLGPYAEDSFRVSLDPEPGRGHLTVALEIPTMGASPQAVAAWIRSNASGIRQGRLRRDGPVVLAEIDVVDPRGLRDALLQLSFDVFDLEEDHTPPWYPEQAA